MKKKFEKKLWHPSHYCVEPLCTAAMQQLPHAYSLVSCHCKQLQSTCIQFEKLPLQPGSSHVAARVCMQRGGRIIQPSRRPVALLYGRQLGI
jgi:hypothetical protein